MTECCFSDLLLIKRFRMLASVQLSTNMVQPHEQEGVLDGLFIYFDLLFKINYL